MGIGSKIIGSKARPGRLVTVEVLAEDGKTERLEVELRATPQGRATTLAQRAGMRAEGEGVAGSPESLENFTSRLLIECAFEPGTNTRVFTPDQLDAVMALGAEFDVLRSAALELAKPGKDPVGESAQTASST